MNLLIVYIFLGIILSLFFTPVFKRLASRFDVFAQHNHRSMHEGAIPKWGGGAIVSSVVLTTIVAWLLSPELFGEFGKQTITLLIGSVVLFILGAIDDKLDLDCNLKMFVEICVASLAVWAGWRFPIIVLPAGVEISLGWFSYVISVFWIVGIANAVNIIDGLDGLASSIVIVSSIFAATIAALYGNMVIVVLALIVTGSVMGFVRYNVFPAKIFMGDAGSLPLGFLLACLSIFSSVIEPGKVVVIVPLLLLGIPIFDTLLAIVRRVRKRVHPFSADNEHIHHRLVQLGLSHSGVSMFMGGVSFILGLLAFLIAHGANMDFTLLKNSLP